MEVSKSFKRTIQDYVNVRANTDEEFSRKVQKPGKSIDECCKFILNTVKESGCNGFEDDEIYSIVVHYFDEDNLDPKYLKDINGQCVVNHKVELSEDEKKELKEKAKRDYYEDQLAKQRQELHKTKERKQKQVEANAPDLFSQLGI